jgi:hypothetical protein
MPRQNASAIEETWIWAGSPNGGVAIENYGRELISADLAALTTQVMLCVGVPVQGGEPVASITFLSGATAANVPTNYWAALYRPDGTLIVQSPDKLTAAWAADTAVTFTLSAPFGGGDAGVYYAALMVKATTPPSLMGRSVNRATASGAIASGQKILAQTSGSGLTGTAPATIAAGGPLTVVNVPYVALR